jgi:hypothetical protein
VRYLLPFRRPSASGRLCDWTELLVRIAQAGTRPFAAHSVSLLGARFLPAPPANCRESRGPLLPAVRLTGQARGMIRFPGAKEGIKEASLSTPENFFGEGIAERYDESHSEMFASSIVGPAVDFLAGVAGKGAALELGIGTGRIALPLARRGVRVHGIELSEAMVQQLRAKPGATMSRSPSETSRRPRSRAPSRLPTSSSIRSTT